MKPSIVTWELPVFSKGFKRLQSKREFHLLRPGQHETSDEEEDLVLGIKPPEWDGERCWYIPAHRIRSSRSPLALWLHSELGASVGYMRLLSEKGGEEPSNDLQPAIEAMLCGH